MKIVRKAKRNMEVLLLGAGMLFVMLLFPVTNSMLGRAKNVVRGMFGMGAKKN